MVTSVCIPRPKQTTPKVAAAVAVVAAFSSMVVFSQAIGSLEWAADTAAGRHLVSFEALREQGYHDSSFSGPANDCDESFRFSICVGHENSSQTIKFGYQGGFVGDANHFLDGSFSRT